METKKIKTSGEFVIYILAILGLIVIANYFGTRIFKRIDMTDTKQYSVSKATKLALKDLNDIVSIKVFFSKDLPPHLNKLVTDVKDVLSEYQAIAGKNLRITWVDPAKDQETKDLARTLGIPEVQLNSYEKDKSQKMNCYLGIAILYEDKKEALPVVMNLENLEYDLTMSIMKVSRKSVPKVGILKLDTFPTIPPQYRAQMGGNNPESTEEKFSKVYEQLRASYDVSTVDLAGGEPIDSSIKTLIVPGIINMTNRKTFEIDQFFMNGGNLIVLADAVTVDLKYGANATPQESKLLDLLEFYGVRVEKNMILDPSCSEVTVPQQIAQGFTMNVQIPYPYFMQIGPDGFNKKNPAISTLSNVVFPWVSSLTLLVDKNGPDSAKTASATQNDVNGTVLIQSSAGSWPVSGSFDLNPNQQWAQPAESGLSQFNVAAHLSGNFKSFYAGKQVPPVKDIAADDTMSQINLQTNPADASRAITSENSNGQLVVISDADFLTGQFSNSPGNAALLLNLTDWLSLDNNLISVRTRAIKNRTINSDLLKKSTNGPTVIRIVNIIVMPLIVIIIGLIIFYRRRDTAPVSAAPTSKMENSGK
jgi:gliding-associated putative ABC transporter substrate-binding component GldG